MEIVVHPETQDLKVNLDCHHPSKLFQPESANGAPKDVPEIPAKTVSPATVDPKVNAEVKVALETQATLDPPAHWEHLARPVNLANLERLDLPETTDHVVSRVPTESLVVVVRLDPVVNPAHLATQEAQEIKDVEDLLAIKDLLANQATPDVLVNWEFLAHLERMPNIVLVPLAVKKCFFAINF
jgi:hypothetical protein